MLQDNVNLKVVKLDQMDQYEAIILSGRIYSYSVW